MCPYNRLPCHLSDEMVAQCSKPLPWKPMGFQREATVCNESMKVHYMWLDESSHSAFLTKKGSFNENTSFSVLARAFHVMNSLVAYTLQQEIQHVCQGYLGKSHSLVCGSVAFYYLPQSFKSNSISSLLPGPSSVSVERTLDRR